MGLGALVAVVLSLYSGVDKKVVAPQPDTQLATSEALNTVTRDRNTTLLPTLKNSVALPLAGKPGPEIRPDEPTQSQTCWSQCGSPCVLDGNTLECAKECMSDNECESEELCIITKTATDGSRPRRCQRDQCSGLGADSECGPEKTCSYVGRMEGSIYRCLAAGLRRLDEPCGHDEYNPTGLCQRGLQCSNGTCAPSWCESDKDCGKRSRCFLMAGGDDLRQCVSYCENDNDCAPDDICNMGSVSAHCVSPDTLGCVHDGCSKGMECVISDAQPYLTIASCMSSCTESSECSDNMLCGNTVDVNQPYCYQPCGPDMQCKVGWTCQNDAVSTDEDNLIAACVRDIPGTTSAFFQKHNEVN